MTALSIKKQRCQDVLEAFMKSSKGCVFLTLTTKDVVDIVEIRKRWRSFRNGFVRALGNGTLYVSNYEIHPKGHGWHIHGVFNRYCPSSLVLRFARRAGFGRVDFRRVNSRGVADYLTKHALKAYRGVSRREMARNPSFRLRLVNASRGLPILSDYEWRSEHKTRALYALRSFEQNQILRSIEFHERYNLASVGSQLGLVSSSAFLSLYSVMHYQPDALPVFLSSIRSIAERMRPAPVQPVLWVGGGLRNTA